MSQPPNRTWPDPIGAPIPDETLQGYASLGRKLAVQMAEANFRTITATPSWTMADIEVETDRAIERMGITSHDILAGKGADPDGTNWREIWTAMVSAYHETMVALLNASGLQRGVTL